MNMTPYVRTSITGLVYAQLFKAKYCDCTFDNILFLGFTNIFECRFVDSSDLVVHRDSDYWNVYSHLGAKEVLSALHCNSSNALTDSGSDNHENLQLYK